MTLPYFQGPIQDNPVDYARLRSLEELDARIAELQAARPDPLVALKPGAPRELEARYRAIARELCSLREERELVQRLGVGAKWHPVTGDTRFPLNRRARAFKGLSAEELAQRMRDLLAKAEATSDRLKARSFRYQAATYRWKAEQRAIQTGQPIPDMPKEAAA